MSDFPFLFGDPDDMKKITDQLHEQHETARLHNVTYYHETLTALESMTLEQLESVRVVLGEVTGKRNWLNGFWFGLVTYMLKSQHNICPACHKDHDAELAGLKENDE